MSPRLSTTITCPGGYGFDRVPLQGVAAAIGVEGVHVLPGRDEPHGEGLGDEAVGDLAQRPHAEQLELRNPRLYSWVASVEY